MKGGGRGKREEKKLTLRSEVLRDHDDAARGSSRCCEIQNIVLSSSTARRRRRPLDAHDCGGGRDGEGVQRRIPAGECVCGGNCLQLPPREADANGTGRRRTISRRGCCLNPVRITCSRGSPRPPVSSSRGAARSWERLCRARDKLWGRKEGAKEEEDHLSRTTTLPPSTHHTTRARVLPDANSERQTCPTVATQLTRPASANPSPTAAAPSLPLHSHSQSNAPSPPTRCSGWRL